MKKEFYYKQTNILILFLYRLITAILLKNAIFEILPNFEPTFRDEDLEVEKKPEDILKRIVLAS